MRIEYTNHAEYQLNARCVERVWVEETIKAPNFTKRQEHKFYVTKKLNGKTLRVVYVRETHIKVITMYWV
ncbi:DUF4258 domain-containing protein [Candidatus Woesearchaeota archaeon]|nr:DUF4258 domain-containing protein [Candidatus Woesearchaeota archaeon]